MAGRFVRLLVICGLVLSINGLSGLGAPVAAAARLGAMTGSGSQTGGRRIEIRVRISEPAPSGGTRIGLAASSAAVAIPSSVTVPAGAMDKLVSISTDPVVTDTSVTLTASLDGITRSHVVLIKAPVLSRLSLQTVIRHGGLGRVTVGLSGNAPTGGFTVSLSTDPTGYLAVGPSVTIPAGQHQVSLKVAASLFGEADVRMPDLPVTVTASSGDTSFTKHTIIRDFGDDPRPTPTNTATPTETATATNTATVTATDTATATATDTATATATNTATATATDTATATATVVLNRNITISYAPTGDSNYCSVIVHMTGFAPGTLYTVQMYSTYPDGTDPHLESAPTTTTDGSGNSTFTAFTFVSYWAFKAVVGDYTSAVYPGGC